MWSLEGLLSFLQRVCDYDALTQANLIDFIKLRYSRIYNDDLDHYKDEGTFSLVSGTKFYYIDRQLNLAKKPKFFNQSQDSKPIEVVDYERILKADPDQDETGTPWCASFVEMCQVKRQPNESSDAGTVGIKSSSASDTSQKVTIAGLRTVSSQVIEDQEEITLTGTTFVSATKTGWHTFRVVSKNADTIGMVTVSVSDGGSVYSVLPPYSRNSWYQKWRMWPTPDVTDTIRYLGFRFPIVPQEDSAVLDVPPDLVHGFVQGLRADAHDDNYDMIKAQKYDAIFEAELQKAKENNLWGDGQILIEGGAEKKFDPFWNIPELDEDIEV